MMKLIPIKALEERLNFDLEFDEKKTVLELKQKIFEEHKEDLKKELKIDEYWQMKLIHGTRELTLDDKKIEDIDLGKSYFIVSK